MVFCSLGLGGIEERTRDKQKMDEERTENRRRMDEAIERRIAKGWTTDGLRVSEG